MTVAAAGVEFRRYSPEFTRFRRVCHQSQLAGRPRRDQSTATVVPTWRVMSRCDLCCVVSVTQLAVGGAVNVTTGRYHDEPRATLHTRHTLAVGSLLLSRPGTPDCSSVAIQLAIHDSAHVR